VESLNWALKMAGADPDLKDLPLANVTWSQASCSGEKEVHLRKPVSQSEVRIDRNATTATSSVCPAAD